MHANSHGPIVSFRKIYIHRIFKSKLLSLKGTKCQTPKNENGFCVPLLQCRTLTDLLIDVRKNPDNRNYLRQSRCGSGSSGAKNVRVCCPIESLGNDAISQSNGLLPSLAVCGLQSEDKIPDDNKAKLDDYPWTVQLLSKDSE